MSVRLSKAIRVADAADALLIRVQAFEDFDFEKVEGRPVSAHIGIDPMLLALSMELALKAWCMFDFDSVDVKRSHHLGKLFDALKPESQKKLEDAFKSTIAPTQFPRFFYGDIGFRDFLDHHANAFVDWRYLHEVKHAHFNVSAFKEALEMVLCEFRNRYQTLPY